MNNSRTAVSVWVGGSGGAEMVVGATAWFSFLALDRTQAWWQVTALPESLCGPHLYLSSLCINQRFWNWSKSRFLKVTLGEGLQPQPVVTDYCPLRWKHPRPSVESRLRSAGEDARWISVPVCIFHQRAKMPSSSQYRY